MEDQLLRLATMPRIAIVSLAMAIIAVACVQEPDLHFDVVDEARPSFSFSGRSIAVSFEISELPPSKPLSKAYGLKGRTIWMISTSASGIKAAQWPRVAYGDVPNGFSQAIPEEGPPPEACRGQTLCCQDHRVPGRYDFHVF